MSFLIEDILKRDSSKDCKKESPKNENVNSFSILQQTLLNKVNPYCASDYYVRDRFYDGHEKAYPVHHYMDFYVGAGHPYFSPYTRTRFFAYPPSSTVVYFNSKRKGGQVRFTSGQIDTLEKRFNSHKYLSPQERRILANSLKLTDKQVKTWFQNRRAKWRRSNSSSSTEEGSRESNSHFNKTK